MLSRKTCAQTLMKAGTAAVSSIIQPLFFILRHIANI